MNVPVASTGLTRALGWLGTAGLLAVGNAHAQSYSDVAQVISATPIYERTATPRQECWNETVMIDRRSPSSDTGYVEANAPRPASGERAWGGGTVLGALLGGIAGYQFGSSQAGRNTGAAVGAVLGGIVGNSIENAPASTGSAVSTGPARVDYAPETRIVQRCRNVAGEMREQLIGYDVTYRYGGREYTTRMNHDPGPSLGVRVTLAPESRR